MREAREGEIFLGAGDGESANAGGSESVTARDYSQPFLRKPR